LQVRATDAFFAHLSSNSLRCARDIDDFTTLRKMATATQATKTTDINTMEMMRPERSRVG
jgi:hypothetical protein